MLAMSAVLVVAACDRPEPFDVGELDVINFLYTVHFSDGDIMMRLAFPEDGTRIVGIQMGD
jgi:hypothetical protein